MGIVIRHDPPFDLLGEVAFAIGQAEASARASAGGGGGGGGRSSPSKGALKKMAARQAFAKQQASDLEFERKKEFAGLQSDLANQRTEFQFNQRQRAQRERLEQAREEMLSNPSLSSSFKRQAAARIDGQLSSMVRRTKVEAPQDQLFEDPRLPDAILTRDNNGMPRIIGKKSDYQGPATPEDRRQASRQRRRDRFAGPQGEFVDPETGYPIPTQAEAGKLMSDAMRDLTNLARATAGEEGGFKFDPTSKTGRNALKKHMEMLWDARKVMLSDSAKGELQKRAREVAEDERMDEEADKRAQQTLEDAPPEDPSSRVDYWSGKIREAGKSVLQAQTADEDEEARLVMDIAQAERDAALRELEEQRLEKDLQDKERLRRNIIEQGVPEFGEEAMGVVSPELPGLDRTNRSIEQRREQLRALRGERAEEGAEPDFAEGGVLEPEEKAREREAASRAEGERVSKIREGLGRWSAVYDYGVKNELDRKHSLELAQRVKEDWGNATRTRESLKSVKNMTPAQEKQFLRAGLMLADISKKYFGGKSPKAEPKAALTDDAAEVGRPGGPRRPPRRNVRVARRGRSSPRNRMTSLELRRPEAHLSGEQLDKRVEEITGGMEGDLREIRQRREGWIRTSEARIARLKKEQEDLEKQIKETREFFADQVKRGVK